MKKMLMARQIHKRLDEGGFASIVIALILIIVLALFTVGFAQLARREQRSALDKQLATQAYYAAESGVNDTIRKLPALETGPAPDPDNCLSVTNAEKTVGPAENGVQYTCVLVNLTPPNIVYDNIQPEASRYITSSTNTAPGSLTVNWGSTDGHTSFPGNTSGGFTPVADWNAANRPGVLQFSITPLSDLSRGGLMNNTFTVYLYPVSGGGGSVAYNNGGGGANGSTVAANCNVSANGAKYPCRVTITGLAGYGTGPYLFRIIDHYDPSNVSINGKDSLTGTAIKFDGQHQIDVTGKAHEVLKRIQVRVPKKSSYDSLAKDALEGQNICKHFSTDPVATGGFTDVGLAGYPSGTDLSACNYN